jgi:hypothetical protein
MKKFILMMLLIVIIGNIEAVDTESYQFIDHLLGLTKPGAPEIYEDGVIFTAPSSYKRVGVAFAHEQFTPIHWFSKLLISEDNRISDPPGGKSPPPAYTDSGILFTVYTPPADIRELEYRLVIDGLWIADPLNPQVRLDRKSGTSRSLISIPQTEHPPSLYDGQPGALSFNFQTPSSAPADETVTVAGSFNGWDPCMYPLRKIGPGRYTLTIPLLPGTYQYVFYYRGERVLDPNNLNRVYTAEGGVASEAMVR